MKIYNAQGQLKRYERPAVLADGQLPTVQAAIYTSPTGLITRVQKITLFNTNAATQTIDLFIDVGGTPRAFRRIELAQYESVDVLADEDEIILDAGDQIEAVTTTATAVDYYLGGVTEK